ncbi:MAG: hypothetical protein HZA78_10645 [Candidatus Schekmanbacteria bacterium]|nr:hypothetical protein [Candidatus Schekmanbacteria bacterium]
MNFKQKLAEALFGDVIQTKVREAYSYGVGVDSDDWQYRKLTGKADKDLSPLTQERMLKIASHLYDTNPLAHRIIEMTKDFVVGEGIGYQAQDKRVKELLDEFWYDPVNHWDLKQHQRALELGLYGEQCYPVFVNEVNGHVRLGYIDPLQIAEVVPDEGNVEEIKKIRLKGQGGSPGQEITIISPDEDPLSPTYGYLTGAKGHRQDAGAAGSFFFAINKVSNATRGRSDLLCLSDWIDAYDQLLFNRLDRAALLNAFIWDITLEGMDGRQIQEWLRQNQAPKPGSIRAHNERVKWEAVSPDLKSAEAETEAKLIKSHILGGAGLPPHWFAEGGDVNRATAAEMGEPVIKHLRSRQRYFRYMLEHIFRFVIDQAIIHRRLPKGINRGFSLIMPEISLKDTLKLSSSLQQVTNSLSTAQEKGWITSDAARKVFANLVSQLGVEINE